MELRLHSPVGAGREYDLVYVWPTAEDKEVNYTEDDLAEEIRETFSAVLCDHPEISFRIPPISALCKYEALKALCDKWNNLIDDYTCSKTFVSTRATLPQAQHIIGQVYNRTITYPERLNQYSAFSPNVYGETSPKMVSHMIRQLRITENDTFLDLGSGVGQVVLQMAAAANFKRCVGIETCETPCEYAVGLQNEFKNIMKWYGKTHTEFRLYNGDFLDQKFRDTILKSSIIFANNYAFGPGVDHQLKEIFADLDDGVRIVSSKQFSHVNFRINQRNLTDIGTIMNVSTMSPFEGAVSWTHSKVSFYLQMIDRSKLERYFEEYAKSQQQNAVPAEKPKRRSVKPPDPIERKENVENAKDKPKKRTSKPRFRPGKKPRRSDSSANTNTNCDVILGEVDVPNKPNFSEAQELPQEMPKLQPEMFECQSKRPELHQEVLECQPKKPDLQPQMPECQTEMPERKPQIPERKPQMPERQLRMPERQPQMPKRHPQMPKRHPQMLERQPQMPKRQPQMLKRRPQMHERQPKRPNLRPEIPERQSKKPDIHPDRSVGQPNKPEPQPDKTKSPPKLQALIEKSKNRSRPPKKRKSEVEILQSAWNLSSHKDESARTSHSSDRSSHSSDRSSQTEDPYADAPWRNVQITDGPPKCVDELLAKMRVQYFEMLECMQNRAYRQNVLEAIRVEKERNEQLKKNKAHLEEVVSTLMVEGKTLLTVQLSDVGYNEDNVKEMIDELQFLSNDHVRLSLKKADLKGEIATLEENVRQLLVPDINQQVQKMHTLKKNVTELTDALHHITSQTPPTVFPDSPPSEGDFSNEEVVHPAWLYVNDVRVCGRHGPHVDDIPRMSVVTGPAASADEPAIPPSYKISPSSILPKKRR